MNISKLFTACLLPPLLLAGCGKSESLVNRYARFLTEPNTYVCMHTDTPPLIDGVLDDEVWGQAGFDARFSDISGEDYPSPRFNTRVKLLWDSDFLYVGAELEEPDLCAYVLGRDEIVYHDNDFEIFLDPDGDGRNYFEIEINAAGNCFDLFLAGPYRDPDRPFISFGWDCTGMQFATAMKGTLNDPSDRDEGWSLELAIPASSVRAEWDSVFAAGKLLRLGFSRVEWQWDVKDGVYSRRLKEDGSLLPEDNWTWGPTGMVAMHMPERWGRVLLADDPSAAGPAEVSPVEKLLWAMFYEQEAAFSKSGRYLKSVPLGKEDRKLLPKGSSLKMESTTDHYKISISLPDGSALGIDQSGRFFTK